MIFKMLLTTTMFFTLFGCAGNQSIKTTETKEVKGKIISILKGAQTFKLENKEGEQVIHWDDQTQFENAQSADDLKIPTIVTVTVDKNLTAKKIKLMIVELPKEMVIETSELLELIESGKKIFIGDSRPLIRYNEGHLPGAVSTPPDVMEKDISFLPKDKNALIVFYCGGPTCPFSPQSAKIAKEKGYTNVKVYVDGEPMWAEEFNPLYVGLDFVKKNMDKHHVIIDVRNNPRPYIKGAAHFTPDAVTQIHDQFTASQTPMTLRHLPNLRDKKAPIFIYADKPNDENAKRVWEILYVWGYKKHAIIGATKKQWKKALAVVSKGKPQPIIVYERKVVPGVAKIEEFIAYAKGETDGLIVDVRSYEETSKEGSLNGSVKIPFSQLAAKMGEVPKDKNVIFICATGARASLAYTMFNKAGYTMVKYLDDTLLTVLKENNISLVK